MGFDPFIEWIRDENSLDDNTKEARIWCFIDVRKVLKMQAALMLNSLRTSKERKQSLM